MQSVNIPLFELENTKSSNNLAEPNTPQVGIIEEKVITPLVQVLEHITPTPLLKPNQSLEQSRSFNESLDNLFPEQLYNDKEIQKAKEILGEITNDLTLQQFSSVVSEVKYLTESWLDDFERDIFGGQTLQELLHNKR